MLSPLGKVADDRQCRVLAPPQAGGSEPGQGSRSSQTPALQQETGNLLSPPSSEG